MSFCGYIGSVLADAGDILAVIIIGVFILFSAVANLIHAAIAKKEEQALEEQKPTADVGEKPASQKAGDRQYQRLPYARMAEKPPLAAGQSKSAVSRPVVPQTLAHSLLKTAPSKPPKVLYPVAQVAGPRKDVASRRPSITQPKPVQLQYRTAPPAAQKKPEKTAKSIAQKSSGEIDVFYLQKMLKNPDQIRYLVVASEILGKPLSLR